MKTFISLLAALALAITAIDASAGGSSGGTRPYYGGGKHSESHGGRYQGGQGKSHKGGEYKNPKSSDQYGKHKP